MIKISSQMEKYRQLPVQIKASIWFLICSFLQRGISTITTPIFTRLLSTAEYGQYAAFNSWLSIVSIFVTLNLSYGVYTQGLIKFSEERSEFASAFQGLTLTICIGWTVVYLLFHDFWNNVFSLTTVQMIAMLSMAWSTAVFGLWAAEQRVLYKYQKLVILTIIVSIAKPIVGIAFVLHFEDKVTARIIGLALVEIVCYAGLFIKQLKCNRKIFSSRIWKYAIKFNLPLIPHYLSQTILSSADRIMIRDMVGKAETGIYGLAYSISMIMTFFNNALMQTISPWIYQKIKEKKEKEIAPVAYATLVLIASVNIFLMAFAPEVVSLFAPSEYYDAIYVIPPVAMSVFFMYCYDLFAKFAFYFEKTSVLAIASVAGAFLNIVLNYVFIKIYGYIAAGYTTLACYVLYALIHYIFMNKVCEKNCNGHHPYKLSTILGISAMLMGVGFILLLSYQAPIIRYCLILAMSAILVTKRREIVATAREMLYVRKATQAPLRNDTTKK